MGWGLVVAYQLGHLAMRRHLPASFGRFRIRLSTFDALWAALTPIIALSLRGALILEPSREADAALYWSASLAFALISFLIFRLNDGISKYFSVDDAIDVLKASCGANLMSALFLFSFTRLDGIPRSIPLIQTLILAFGLLTVRGLHLWRDTNGTAPVQDNEAAPEHVLMIGANRLTALYIKFLHAYSPHQYRIIGIIDTEVVGGRMMLGIPVLSAGSNIEHVIREFETHGINTSRIIVGGDETFLAPRFRQELGQICKRREIMMQFVPDLIGLDKLQAATVKHEAPPTVPNLGHVNLPHFHRTKRLIDFFLSGAAIVALSPFFIIAGGLALLDVGTPLLFWQQRLGRGGRTFLIHKFRTYRAPYDRRGQSIPEAQRLSFVGTLLRRTRFDELPQLFSVLVGDMSLIGPRPLLPHDQPADTCVRLSVRPGITGWAQANGGNLVDAEEKGALDEYYVRNASLWLDLRILGLTLLVLLRGERRNENAIREAIAARKGEAWTPRYRETARWQIGSVPRATVRVSAAKAHSDPNDVMVSSRLNGRDHV